MTPDQLESAARNRYNAISDPFYSSEMIRDIIYQACMEMANEANVIERVYTTTSTSGTREYSYPTNAKAIRRVEYDGEKVIPVSLDMDPKTSTTEVSGDPATYGIWNQEIYFFPTPSATGDTIKIFTFNRPQRITTGSQTLEVPEQYHLDIIEYILSIFYAKDQNHQMSVYHRNLWREALARIKRENAKRHHGDMFAVVKDEDEIPYFPGMVY